jgi:hypothetical protein
VEASIGIPFYFCAPFTSGRTQRTFCKARHVRCLQIGPNKPTVWALYGFKWLGIFFYELATVFGNCATPLHFDFVETIIQLAITMNKISRQWTLHQLDDTIVVAPGNTCSGLWKA